MKKQSAILFTALSLLLLSGCFNFETSALSGEQGQAVRLPDGEPTFEHAVVSNFGWYFFNRFPIVCGNALPDRRCPWAFFRNDVDDNILQERLISYTTAQECDIMELNIFNNEEALMTIGVGGLSIPLPYIITFRELQYSGVLVKREKSGEISPQIKLRREMKKLNIEMRNLLDQIPDGGEQ